MKVATVPVPCAAAAPCADHELLFSGASLGPSKADVNASAEGVRGSRSHPRCPCHSKHSDVSPRWRSSRILPSLALLLAPVLLMGVVPVVTSAYPPMVTPRSPLQILDAANFQGDGCPSQDIVDSAVVYLKQKVLQAYDFQVLPHLASTLSKRRTYNRVLSAIAVALQRRQECISGYNARSTAMLLHSLARGRINRPTLLNALGKHALTIMTLFDAEDVANTAWAFAALSIKNHDLFNALANRALSIMTEFKAHGVASTAWAFATLSIENRDLFSALADRALATMRHFRAQGVANTAWAFATMSIENRALFNALADRALATMRHLSAQGVANTAWAFATLSIENRALFSALAGRTLSIVTEFNPQDVANTAWAFSVVRFHPDDSVFEAIVGRVCFFFSSGSFADEQLVQLHLWRLSVGERAFDSVVDGVCHVKTDVMVSSFRDAMSRQGQGTSRMEHEVVGALQRMYSPGSVHRGAFCEITGYSLDAACVLPFGRRMVAVEVNDRTHFLRDCHSDGFTSINGASRLKRHLLGRYGWTVVDVNFGDWDKANGIPEQQQDLLLKLLRRTYSDEQRAASTPGYYNIEA
ncbi:RAP domain-containing protein [Plasmodiophora brassicae]